MQLRLRLVSIIAVSFGLGLMGAAQAQTPLPNTTQKLTLPWLGSLTLNPTTVPAGTNIVGTVTLLRPAIANLAVGIGLAGATPVEGGIWVADGAIVQSSVTVPAGSDRATFTITTAKPQSTTGSKSFTVTASYGNERKSASFTTTQLVRPKFP